MLYWLTQKIITAYIYSTLTFFSISIFRKTIHKRTENFLNIANGLIVVGLFLNFLATVLNVISCRATQLGALQKSISDSSDFDYGNNCFSLLVWTLFLGFLFQLCFFLKRFRIKIVTSFVSIILLIALINLENIIILITSLHRDYLPSNWSDYNEHKDNLWTLGASIIYFIACWTFSKSKISLWSD